jgi:formylglycine-generating enzyme required for sulfatase activity
MMGSPVGENGRDDDETLHQVTLTQPFYCGKFAVTQRQWKRVMGNNPSKFTRVGEDAPVEQVSWKDCKDFLQKLCKLEGVPQGTYRLLTEAEWEYACRAGTSTAFCYGDSLNSSQANFNGHYPYNSSKEIYRKKTTVAGGFEPNAFGLYDMHGNVWEWCNDRYETLPKSSETDPAGALSGSGRVIRGGGCGSLGGDCRSADRSWDAPSYRYFRLGFRLARVTPVNK